MIRYAWFVAIVLCVMCGCGLLVETAVAGSTTEVNFQGILEDNSGNPINGTYDLRFSIYTQASSVVWPEDGSAEEHSQVNIDNGLFSVLLGSQGKPVNSTCFDGSDRFLQIEICTTADPGCSVYEALSPQQKLTSVIYASCASSFIPGVQVTGSDTVMTLTSTATTGTAISGIASASTGSTAAVYGSAQSADGAGVAGYNTGAGFGLYGSSSTGYAVYANGKAHVEGELTTSPATSYTWVHNSDFKNVAGYDLGTSPSGVFMNSALSPTEVAYAPVDLPHGATIVNLIGHFYDNSVVMDGQLRLVKVNAAGISTDLTTASTSGFAILTRMFTGAVSGPDAVVDNESEGIYVYVTLARETDISAVSLRGVSIEYTYTKP